MSFFQGALQTSTVALLPDVVSASAVSSVFGLYQSVSALSAQLGPALGGALAAAVGFEAVFPIAGTALLVLGLPAFYVFRRLARPTTRRSRPAEETAGQLRGGVVFADLGVTGGTGSSSSAGS
jgi:MFS family permease